MIKFVVDSEEEKRELIDASRHIHYLRDVDTDIPMVNTLCHVYVAPHLIEVKGNATTLSGARCVKCHWPIISALCNDAMATTPPYKDNDWWMYCANKACEHHEGGPHNPGEEPDFVQRL